MTKYYYKIQAPNYIASVLNAETVMETVKKNFRDKIKNTESQLKLLQDWLSSRHNNDDEHVLELENSTVRITKVLKTIVPERKESNRIS